jgi:hypothetical protein
MAVPYFEDKQGNKYGEGVCYDYPFNHYHEKNSINSKFSDGVVTTRPRITPHLTTYELAFRAIPLKDKLDIQKLEEIVGTTEQFKWMPNIAIDLKDYWTDPDDPNAEPVLDIKKRTVRLVEPIHYKLIAFQLYDFDMKIQTALDSIYGLS